MSELPGKADFVIIGGGVMGASTAYHLAVKGAKNILLLEKQPFFGMGATGKCAGGIRYQFSTEINIRLSQASLPMLARFAAEMDQEIDYQECGYLFLLTREADIVVFRRNVTLQHKLGVQTAWWSGDEVRRRLPQLQANDVLAGVIHPKDGLADPHGVVSGYIQAARRRGVTALNGITVTGIDSTAGRIQAVQTTKGPVVTPVVVNAAGPWSGRVSDLAGIPLPVTPLRRQMVTTTAVPGISPDFPFVIDFAQSLYFHREGPGLLTGMSNPHETPGFDESVDAEWEQVHMTAAIDRLPALAHAGRISGWAGLYENTPDAHPIFGGVPQLAGYYLVTGFSGHGFMHGPVAGLLTAEIILEGQASTVDVRALNLARFAEGRLIQEYNVI
jgi:sarcosine oxidase subunit beta